MWGSDFRDGLDMRLWGLKGQGLDVCTHVFLQAKFRSARLSVCEAL